MHRNVPRNQIGDYLWILVCELADMSGRSFRKTAYLKRHIISSGSLCMTRMNISVKLSMMSELCTPFITICSITNVLYYKNIQHIHKHLVCNTPVRLCFRHVGT